MQRSGERLRVSVNLLRVGDGTSLWAESFSVPFSGIFEVQDEVSRQVASRLQGRLTATERDKLARRSTSNPDAYLAYAKAVYYFGNRGARPGKDPATENAIELLQQAITLDPNFALAHAQLGYAYAWSAIFFEDNPSWMARAKKELEVAAGLDANLAKSTLQGASSSGASTRAFRPRRPSGSCDSLRKSTLRQDFPSLPASTCTWDWRRKAGGSASEPSILIPT